MQCTSRGAITDSADTLAWQSVDNGQDATMEGNNRILTFLGYKIWEQEP